MTLELDFFIMCINLFLEKDNSDLQFKFIFSLHEALHVP